MLEWRHLYHQEITSTDFHLQIVEKNKYDAINQSILIMINFTDHVVPLIVIHLGVRDKWGGCLCGQDNLNIKTGNTR